MLLCILRRHNDAILRKLQLYMVLPCQPSHVYQSVTHPSEACVYAHTCNLRNLFEGVILVVTFAQAITYSIVSSSPFNVVYLSLTPSGIYVNSSVITASISPFSSLPSEAEASFEPTTDEQAPEMLECASNAVFEVCPTTSTLAPEKSA